MCVCVCGAQGGTHMCYLGLTKQISGGNRKILQKNRSLELAG